MLTSPQRPPGSVESLLNHAVASQQAGHTAEAIAACQKILAQQTCHPQALFLLGVALAQAGRLQEAIPVLTAAIEAQPDQPLVHHNLALAFRRLHRWADALASYERAIMLLPHFAEAHDGRGIALIQLGRREEALVSLERTVALRPEDALAHYRLGVLLLALHRSADALTSFERALTLRPDMVEARYHRGVTLAMLARPEEALESLEWVLCWQPSHADALYQRGVVLGSLGRFEQALSSLDAALLAKPNHADTHNHRGLVLTQLGCYPEAHASYERALELDPQLAQAYNNRASAFGQTAQFQQALECAERALALNPDLADAHSNRGNALKGLQRHHEAAHAYDRALVIEPADAQTRYNKGLLLLLLGDLRSGWPLYEERFRVESVGTSRREAAVPLWNGSQSLAGKTLLVYCEQGYGDTLQFCRFAACVRRQAARVILEVQPRLRTLVRSLDSDVEVIAQGESTGPFDYHCPLLSLPMMLGIELPDIPPGGAYLRTDQRAVHRWAQRLQGISEVRIGIAWQGNPAPEKTWARGRSVPLTAFRAIAGIDAVRLISLQKGPGTEQLKGIDFGERITKFGDDFDAGPDAMLDTAAVMANLDLVITSDTSIAHLAGALGVPVWVALQTIPSWRWLLDRADCPWYPGMRLFRQRQEGDWASVFEHIANELPAWIQTRPRAPA